MINVKSLLPVLAMGCALATSLFCGGCSSPDNLVRKSEKELDRMEDYAESGRALFQRGQYEAAEKIFDSLHSERTVSQLQYKYELISLMLLQGRHDEAHRMLLKLKNEIDYLSDRKSEKEAQSLWHGEQKKVFKGDPFERCTLHMLLALSFLQRKDPESALSVVKSGLLYDGDSEKGEFAADYGLLQFLGAVCHQRLGDKQEAKKWLSAAVKNLEARGYTLVKAEDGTPLIEGSCFEHLLAAQNNTYIVVWAGDGPSMVRKGQYNEDRVIIPGQMPIDSLVLEGQNGKIRYLFPPKLADINFQAMTRGRRMMNDITSQKAFWKLFINVTSTVLVTTGAAFMMSGHSYGLVIGGGLLAAGVIGYIVAANINPTADKRNWKCLPGEFLVLPLYLPPGTHQLTLSGYVGPDQIFNSPVRIRIPQKQQMNVIHMRLDSSSVKTDYMASYTKYLRTRYFDSTAGNIGAEEIKPGAVFSDIKFTKAVSGPAMER